MNQIDRGPRSWITEGKVNKDTRDTLMQSRQELFKESYKDILPDSWEQVEERTVKLDNEECFPVPTYAPNRWNDIHRDYSRSNVEQLRGSTRIRHTLAEMGAEKLWALLTGSDDYSCLSGIGSNLKLPLTINNDYRLCKGLTK